MSNLALREETPEAQVLARMEMARQQLAAARTVGDAKHVADAAAAVCEWLRRQTEVGLEIVNDANLLKLQAERRIGEFLQQPGTVKGRGRPEKTCQLGTFSPPPTYRELGIPRKAAQRFREVAAVPEETLQEMAQAATRRGREFTRDSVIKVGRSLRLQDIPAVPEGPQEPAPPMRADIPAEFQNAVLTGDARELAKRLPDASVAVCFCDPVYERIEDYEWLARECERVLIPGGSVVAQVGNMRRFECEVAMRKSGLAYVDLLAEVYPFALCPIYPLRIQIGWKPYLWFSNGPRNGEWVMNRVHVGGKSYSDASKALHPWGDSDQFAGGLLEKLCQPGDVVWDPFTGSGVVPMVAKRLGLPFIAFEIDPEKAETASRRVAGTLRVTGPQQALWDCEEALR
jgi:hypothetical protein